MRIETASGEEIVIPPPSVVHLNRSPSMAPALAPTITVGPNPTFSLEPGPDEPSEVDGYGLQRRRNRRMSSGPVYLSPGAPLASVPLSAILPGADPSPRDDGR